LTAPTSVILVGDPADPHVQAVADLLPPSRLVVVDAAHLPEVIVKTGPAEATLIDRTGEPVTVGSGAAARGWLRRLAPTGWDHGVVLGSHRAAVLSSRLALLATVLRDPAVSWLTSVDDLFAAENKIVQYRAAAGLGVRVPRTVVTGDPARIADLLGEPFVLKPLGPGHYADGDEQRVVYVRSCRAADLAGADLLDAPFLAQELLNARRHLRVVTVGGRAWVSELDAAGLAVDWREDERAHHSFTAARSWPEVERAAVMSASALRVGFSCQDWVVDADGPAFVDLNPGGQWLFLPDEMGRAVAEALARWLAAGR
jgi:hypothetical protein